MHKIICSYCREEFAFENLSERPKSCTNCFEPMKELEVQKISEAKIIQTDIKKNNKADKKPAYFTLICLKTNKKIHIDHTEKVVLGRDNFGAEIFECKKISSCHCLIEFIYNQYKITDLGSRNGTYVGISKIDCKENPQQVLNDGDLLFLGKEPFLVQVHINAEFSQKEAENLANEGTVHSKVEAAQERIIQYRCLNCGRTYDRKTVKCEGCNAFGRWEEIVK